MVPYFSRFNTFSFDLETTGLNPIDSRITLCQIAFPDTVFVINPKVGLEPLMGYFLDAKWLKIIQNAKFDTKFLLNEHKTRTNNIFDTKLAEHLLTSDEAWASTSLKTLAKKYLEIELDKSVRESFIDMKPMTVFSQEQLEYAARDAQLLFGIYDQQKVLLADKGLEKVASLEFELSPIVGAMELTGVPIDIKKWNQKLEDYRKQHEESRLEMHRLIFDEGNLTEQIGMFERDSINLNSPKQIKEAFQAIGIDIEATNEREISLINHPAAKELLNYRKLQKIMSSYGESFLGKIHPFTGRIHADYQQLGTATGRFSCKDPNLQQMPDEFRQCVSLKDYKIVTADYSQIELRILAELSGDEAFSKAFNTGEDLHKSTASTMFNIPIENVSAEQRFIAKTINFGISYGMGPNKLMDMLNQKREPKHYLTFGQVNGIMRKYKTTYHRVNEWLQEAGNLAYRRGYSETMYGRKRFFTRPQGGPNFENEVASLKRQGANAAIQGTSADITKLAMLNLYHDLSNYHYDANIILQVHDEIGVLAHKSQAEAIKLVVDESMTQSAQELLKNVPVKVDAYVGDIWKKGE